MRRRATAGLAAMIVAAMLAIVTLTSLACDDHSHTDIGDEINILIRRNDALVAPATDRLAAYGRKAVPQIETALHTAAPFGRLHLIVALDRIGDDESVSVLRHVAVYDVTAEVRDAALALLTRWTTASRKPLAERAQAALTEIARKRAAGEGPLLFGDGGTPGIPSTVGAPDPVGADLEKRR